MSNSLVLKSKRDRITEAVNAFVNHNLNFKDKKNTGKKLFSSYCNKESTIIKKNKKILNDIHREQLNDDSLCNDVKNAIETILDACEKSKSVEKTNALKKINKIKVLTICSMLMGLLISVITVMISKTINPYIFVGIFWFLCSGSLYITVKYIISEWKKI